MTIIRRKNFDAMETIGGALNTVVDHSPLGALAKAGAAKKAVGNALTGSY